MITGHCECGRVRFEIDGAVEDLSHCHCSQCRRLHGAAYATFAGVPRDRFRYLEGNADVRAYPSSNTSDRIFCAHCGSNILVDFKPEPESLYICMGTIDGNPACPPAYHQFVGSKAAWHEITDQLPQHDEWPPE